MGFSLQLIHDLIEVEAGGNSPISISVTNRGESLDRFELEIEGLDAEWKAIPVPTFTAEAGETHAERAFLKPPRVSESVAGNYPFVVKVRSLESGDQKSVQGVLQLKPYHYLTIEIDPKKGLYTWSTHSNEFEIKLVNLGNTEHNLQLSGGDPEDSCTYEFDHEVITLSPGQQKKISVTVTPVSSPILSGSKLIGFSIHARSVDVPSVAAAGQAQLERRSFLSPANLALILFVFVLLGAWIVMKPKPPAIEVRPNQSKGLPGDKVVIQWDAHDADHIVLFSLDSASQKTVIYDGQTQNGSESIFLGAPGPEAIFAEISKGGNRGIPKLQFTLEVDPPAQKVEPKIVEFKGSTHRVRIPGDVVFSWTVTDTVKVALTPDFQDLPPELGTQSVHFDSAGVKEYELVAWSKDGLVKRSAKWTVSAVDISNANIDSFVASPQTVSPGGTASISWNVVNASAISLSYGGSKQNLLPSSGSQQIPLTATTTFVLTATDSQNRSTSKKLTVKVIPPTPPSPPVTPTTGQNDGTTATSTGTTPIPPPATGTGGTSTDATSTGGQGKPR